jgi:hypothetical protein
MKLIKAIFLAIAVAGVAMMYSCSDDDNGTNEPTPDDKVYYFSFEEDNWWIYEGYDLDMNNDRVDDGIGPDSAYYLQKDNLGGKEVETVMVVSSEGGSGVKYFYEVDDTRLNALSAYITPNLPGEIYDILPSFEYPTDLWVKILDPNATSEWVVIPEQTYNEKVSLDFIDPLLGDGDFVGTFNVTAENGPLTTMVIDGKTIEVAETKLNYVLSGQLKFTFITEQTINIDIPLTASLYFGKDKGLVRMIFNSKKVSIPVPVVGDQEFDVEGYEQICTKIFHTAGTSGS